MKNALSVGAALLLTTTAANAGGIERGGNAYGVLFEEGNYVELSYSSVRPDVSGDYPAALGGGSTGNMAEDFSHFGVGLKYGLNDQFDVGLFLNEPYGANAAYGDGFYNGLAADWESNQVAVVLKYQATPAISVFGGVRSVETQAEITINDGLNRGSLAQGLQEAIPQLEAGIAQATAAGATDVAAGLQAQLAGANARLGQAADPGRSFQYDASTNSNRETSYIAGVAYERPEIALRVALTYESGYTHTFEATETIEGNTTVSDFDIEMPQSLTLDFQSGVAADTLVFGSIKWTEWSVWEVRPQAFETFSNGGRVTGLDDDTFTYQLGLGRRINDELSVFGRVTYEGASGGDLSRLAPTDGSTAIGLGGSYTFDDIKITAGVEYVMLGGGEDSLGVEFEDNTAVGFGVSVGYTF